MGSNKPGRITANCAHSGQSLNHLKNRPCAMSTPIDDPNNWLDRAEEARTVAQQLDDPAAKRMMVGIAESYERLAQRAEERRKQRTPPTG